MRNIVKEYFGNRVLKGVSLTVDEGEIHSLIGENGAGKSTLMNVLFGMPVIHNTGGFDGEVLFQGNPVQIRSPFEAMELGIGMVHQEFMLLPGFTVSENIKLNREITRPTLLSRFFGRSMNRLDRPAMDADSRRALDSLGLSLDETTRVAGLPVGYKQFVEIARELDKKKTKILVLDEPTAVLTESEADTLLETMERLAQRGISILFITHRLQEVLRVSRGISVLRDGEKVASLDKKDATVDHLAELMVGRALQSVGCKECGDSPASEEILLTVNDLHVAMPGEEVHGISLDIRKGEILGIGGLAGQGKIGIANGIMGLYPARGAVTKSGRPVPLNDTTSALNAGMAFVSEDRRGVGLLLDQSIEMNIAVPAMQSQGKFLKGPFALADDRAIRTHALRLIKELDIRCTGPMQLTRRLSGGNQQKVCIAKALTLEPDLLFVSEPTRGIDVGAKKIVLDLLVKLNRELGVTIVITSSELAELRAVCDRIALIYHGQLEGILAPDASDKDFGIMMAGGIKGTTERKVS
ncbi:MAG: sugar ABC transporter ATP-binding protein [Synergistaceae bacterium]|nr:sugar ABC transporter ATP-binding protein [Synergistaceae bacterium]